jgi:ABC-type branched-subunit amino acid transport system permease subunit
MTYGVVALGVVLIYKGSRVLNFSQPYMGLFTAFLCWWMTSRTRWLPFLTDTRPRFVVAAILSLGVIMLMAYGNERGVIRHLEKAPRLVAVVATIAFATGFLGLTTALFARSEQQINYARRLPNLLPASFGFNVGLLRVTNAYMLTLIVVPVVAGAAAAFFKFTKFGVGIRAAAENSESAQLLGISVKTVSAFTWVTGAFLAGLAALLIVPIRGSLDTSSLSTGLLVRSFAAALVGGLTSLPGAVVGGVAVGVGESLVAWRTHNQPGTPEVMLFLIIIAVLVLRPQGLFGQREQTEDKVAFIPSIRELPARLRRNPMSTRARATAVTVALMLVAAASLATGPTTNGTLITITIFAIIGVSLTVLIGYAGQISLGHFALAGVGAIAGSRMYEYGPVPFLLMLPAVVVVGMIVSLVIGLPALRIKGLYLAIVTIAFNVAAETYIFKHRVISRGSAGLDLSLPKLGPLDLRSDTNRPLFFFCLAIFLTCVWVANNFKHTRTGRGFFALRENEKAAATFGVELTRYRLLAFALSGGMAALAGVLYGFRLGHISALSFPTERSLVLVSMVIIGGLGSLLGAALGSFLVVGLPLLLHFINPWVVLIGTGILLITVLTRIRGGLAGLVLSARDPVVEGLVWTEPGEAEPVREPVPAATR